MLCGGVNPSIVLTGAAGTCIHIRTKLVKAFEFRSKQTERLPCNEVKDYPVRLADEDPVSDDELDIAHYTDKQDHYGAD